MGTTPELDGRLNQAGRRHVVMDRIPELDGIIFPNTLGWVLMTAGYPPS
jgi:hypothetical protein